MVLCKFAKYSQIIQSYLLTYLLTPWSRVLLEKLTGSAASQEIPRIFGILGFITSGRGLCDGLIIRPEESYRLWCVVVCDQETS